MDTWQWHGFLVVANRVHQVVYCVAGLVMSCCWQCAGLFGPVTGLDVIGHALTPDHCVVHLYCLAMTTEVLVLVNQSLSRKQSTSHSWAGMPECNAGSSSLHSTSFHLHHVLSVCVQMCARATVLQRCMQAHVTPVG